MKRIIVVLVILLSFNAFVAAVPYPYGSYELETRGDLERIRDEVAAKYGVEAQSEKVSILPWSDAGAVIYSMEVLEATGNHYAHQNFMTEKEKQAFLQSRRSQMVDNTLCFMLVLRSEKEEHVVIEGRSSKISTIVLETDSGSIYHPTELVEVYSDFDFDKWEWVTNHTVCFPRYKNKIQIIDEDTKWIKLWVVAGAERIFMQFDFEH